MIPLVGDIEFARAMCLVSEDDTTVILAVDLETMLSIGVMSGGVFMMIEDIMGITDETGITNDAITTHPDKAGEIKLRHVQMGLHPKSPLYYRYGKSRLSKRLRRKIVPSRAS